MKAQNNETVRVEELVEELLKEINFNQQLNGANEFNSVAQHKERGLFHAIRAIADLSGNNFVIVDRKADGPNGKTVRKFEAKF